MEPTNDMRAEWGRHAVNCHARATRSQNEELDTQIGDTLADIMHLCDEAGLVWDDLVETAHMHHIAEVEDEREAA